MNSVKPRRNSALMVAVSILALSTGAALAGPASLPTGGAVTAGAATITSPNATTTVITQNGGKAILTWNDFSIAAGNTVQFNNGTGSTLNRVITGNASELDGALSATGSVYLINPNGIVIGKTGVINTGGTFVASTLDISNTAFLAGGSLTFSGSSTASVTNLGQIGSSGGDVVLIANTVENDGSITAAAGDAGLLAGSSVTLLDTLSSGGKFQVTAGTGASATNTGSVAAATAELRAYGGNVYALAGNGGGAIAATGVSTNDGQVFLTAQAPSGATGVGDVTITGGVSFTGGANALTIDAFHNAHIDSVISTTGGRVTLTANDGGVGGDYDFGLTGTGFSGALNFLGGKGSGESLTINGQAYTLLYSIEDVQNIQNMYFLGHYALANNIDASVTSNWNGGAGFIPIGTNPSYPGGTVDFSGAVDGLGNSIKNLYINRPNQYYAGLLGALYNGSTIRDIALLNLNLIGQSEVGGIVGYNNGGSIENVILTGSVTGNYSVGGLAGYNYGSINDSISAVVVSGSYQVGGLIGQNNGSILRSSASGAVTGQDDAGGLVGSNSASADLPLIDQNGVWSREFSLDVGSITSSFATGTVNGNQSIGGLVGVNTGTIQSSYASGPVVGQYATGGLVGSNGFYPYSVQYQNASNATITNTGVVIGQVSNSSASGAVTGGWGDTGGLVGNNTGLVSNSAASGAVSGAQNVGGLVGNNDGALQASYSTVNGTWSPTSDYANSGSIVASSATGTVTGTGNDVGGLVGSNAGAVQNSSASGAVNGNGYTGGLVGNNITTSIGFQLVNSSGNYYFDTRSFTGSISGSSTSSAVVSSAQYTGGLVGYNSGAISESNATGAVVSTGDATGGLVGYNDSGAMIAASYALGSVSGSSDVGGFVGNNNGGTVTQAYATGAVSGQLSVGGFAGANGGTLSQSYWDSQTSNQSAGVGTGAVAGVAGLTTAQFGSVSNFVGWTFTTTPGGAGWVIVDQDGTLNNSGGAAGATRPLLASEYSTTISNGHQLQLIAMNLGASYIQANDISLAEINNPSGVWITSEGFSPIGNIGNSYSGNSFNGVFDGRGHVIDGLTINGTTPFEYNVGLFASAGNSAVIENVNLTNTSILGGVEVGGLVGTNHGLVKNSSASGVVTGSDGLAGYWVTDTGGLVGDNYGAVVGSASSGTVVGATNYNYTNVGGLVGSIESNASVSGSHSSATVSNTDANSSTPIGGLVGWSAGTISDSYATGNVSSNANWGGKTGGLLGEVYSGSVSNSYATGAVTGGNNVGGLVGMNDGWLSPGLITSSYATGSVSGQTAVGGLVGNNGGVVQNGYATGAVSGNSQVGGPAGSNQVGGLVGSNSGTISASNAAGSVSSNGNDTGGLVGYNSGAISTSYASGIVTSSAEYTGGLVGYNDTAGSIASSYFTGSVSGTTDAGGLIGWNLGAVSNSFYDLDHVSINGQTEALSLGGIYDAQYQNWFGHGLSLNIADYASTVVYNGATSTYVISSVQGLKDLLGFIETAGQTFQLGGDIDLASAPGYFIPYLAGSTFNGAGHTVSGLAINDSWHSGAGFIGQLNGGIVENLHVAGSVTATGGVSNVGGLVGYLSAGTVTSSTSAATVTAAYGNVGGLVGYSDSSSTISNSSASGAVSGAGTWNFFGNFFNSFNVGGLVGLNNGAIANSSASGSVASSGSYFGATGGLVGYNTGSISGSFAKGAVNGFGTTGGLGGDNYSTGGLVGENYGGAISGDFATGSVVSSGNDVGGLVGQSTSVATSYVDNNGVYTNGMFIYNASISSSYATGNVNGYKNVGGLVGENSGSIQSSYAKGNVSGSQYTGGLVGYNDVTNYSFSYYDVNTYTNVQVSGLFAAPIQNSYATGAVSGSGDATGGLIGWNSGLVSASYATGNVSGYSDVGGLVGVNTAGLATYYNYNISYWGPVSDAAYVGTVSTSYASGTVSGSSNTGGLVGSNAGGLVQNSFATGAVSGGSNTGGLIGQNSVATFSVSLYDSNGPSSSTDTQVLTGSVATSYATGAVTASGANLGGVVGLNGGAITSAYWDTQTTGLAQGVGSGSSFGATGLTTQQMLDQANFTGFDFSSTGPWRIVEGSSFPYLSWQFGSTPDVISGTVYSGIGGSTLTGLTVAGYENGSSLASTTSGANGYYQFLLPQGTLQNAAVVTYLTGAPQKASALATGVTGSVTGLNLYEGTFFVETGLTTLSSLPAQISAATGGATPDGLLLSPGHAFLGGLPANTNVWINASGAFTIDQRIDLGTGSLVIDAGGAVSQTSTALIQAGSLSGVSVGGANFIDPANWIGAFSWSNTGTGGVVFGDTEAVHIGTVSAGSGDLTLGGAQSWRIYDDGALTAGGNITLNAAAGIDLNAQVTAGGAVSLISSQGGIAEYGAGAILAASLSGSGLGANLSGANQVATINGFSAPQGFVFNNTVALNVAGPINASNGYLYLTTTAGDLDINGGLTAGINASLRTAGNLALDSTVTAPGNVALNATGSISETGAIIAGTLLGGSNGSAILTGANRIGTLGGFSVWHGGATLSLTDVSALTVAGAVRAGSETFVDTAGLTVTPAGSITALGGGKTLNGAALH